METWLAVLGAAALVGIGLARIKVFIAMDYHRRKADDQLSVEVYLPGRLIVYRLEVPLVQLNERGGLVWLESQLKSGREKTETHTEAEQRFTGKTWDIFLHDAGHWVYMMQQVEYYTRLYKRLANKLLASLVCERLYWETRFGADDPVATSLMTGLLWFLKYQTYAKMRERLKASSRPCLQVTPLYTWVGLEVDFQCIFSIRLGNVINAVAGLTRRSRKGDSRQWVNIQSRV